MTTYAIPALSTPLADEIDDTADEPSQINPIRQVIGLDVVGYGPKGKRTRLEWRAECLAAFEKSKEEFTAFLLDISQKRNRSSPQLKFGYSILVDG